MYQPSLRLPVSASTRQRAGGWTLIELVIVVTILAILSLGVIPLVKTSVRRQREYRLRETLREMREAVKQFKRDTVGIQCAGAATANVGGGGGGEGGRVNNPGLPPDPRSKVIISDCTIFGVDNPDHYPPDLGTLVAGVSIVPRGAAGAVNPLEGNATDNKLLSLKKKVYLRQIPVDPITGKAEWDLRSCYDQPDATTWGGENVFDVRSKAEGEALNGEKYSDW